MLIFYIFTCVFCRISIYYCELLLTIMTAHVTGLKLGDTHIYTNHIDAMKTQIERTPKAFPTLKFKFQVDNIESFQSDDFILEGYNPWPKIDMKMAV